MKTKLLFFAQTLSVLFFPLLASDGIVANRNFRPYFPPPRPFYGRQIWNNARIDERHVKEMREIAREPMTQCGFAKLKDVPYFYSFFKTTPPDNTRLMIREIEIFSGRRNIAGEARIEATADKAEIRYPERLNDGDDSPRSAAFSVPPRMREDQPGDFAFIFPGPRSISAVAVKSGRPRSAKDPDYVHTVSGFSCDRRLADGNWEPIPGAVLKHNTKSAVRIEFKAVQTSGIRVRIQGQLTPFSLTPEKFVNLQADPAGRPFKIGTLVSRPPFNCFESADITPENLAMYQNWKKKNPYFLGFGLDEWDNDFMHIVHGRRKIPEIVKRFRASPAIGRKMQELVDDMKTREGFMRGLKKYYDATATGCFGDREKLVSLDCCMALAHYASEWGSKYCIMETTCNGYQRHQIQMYFARGAARQYERNWGWYIAPTLCGPKGYTDPDYIGKWSLNAAGGDGGFSPSANRRDRYLAWFAGASTVSNEVWPYAYCMDADKDGIWELSPHGEAMKDWFDFITRHPQRGVSYAPIAIAMQWDHGISPINGTRPFMIFPNQRGDMMNEAVLRTFVPYKFGLRDQEWAMSETPYGDLCEVILPDPPSGPVKLDILKNYRVLFLSGTFSPDRELAARLKEYTAAGGTLIINVKQLGRHLDSAFTGIRPLGQDADVADRILTADGAEAFRLNRPHRYEKTRLAGAEVLLRDASGAVMLTRHRHGRGHVIVSMPDHMVHATPPALNQNFYSIWGRDLRFPFMDWLFGRVTDELLPFKVHGHVQYGVNLLDDGLLVYIFNNEGVHKTSYTPEKLDPEKACRVRIDLKKLPVKSVTELRSDRKLAVQSGGEVALTIGPGDIAAVKIECGRLP